MGFPGCGGWDMEEEVPSGGGGKGGCGKLGGVARVSKMEGVVCPFIGRGLGMGG